jgi:D-alanine-D-alanine ligase
MKVGIIYNVVSEIARGNPIDIIAEQDILNTVHCVEDALRAAGHEVKLIHVDDNLYENLRAVKLDLVFNLGEGIGSNILAEAYIPAMLDMVGIPYTGSNFLTLSVCLDKAKTKQILLSMGLPTARFQIFKSPADELDLSLKFPMIVKPIHEDASIGITNESVVKDEEQLRKRIAYVIETYKQNALAEEFIEGREVNVSIIGNKDPIALPIEELQFTNFSENAYKICSYQAKWIPNSEEFQKTIPVCPAQLPKNVENRIKRLALAAYKVMECQDYARIDIRIDKDNNSYILEVNPNPDIGPVDTAFTRAAAANSISYNELITKILDYAIERQHSEKRVEEKIRLIEI